MAGTLLHGDRLGEPDTATSASAVTIYFAGGVIAARCRRLVAGPLDRTPGEPGCNLRPRSACQSRARAPLASASGRRAVVLRGRNTNDGIFKAAVRRWSDWGDGSFTI